MKSMEIQVLLSQAEALVLFEWLARSDSAEALHTECAAEQKVLWKLEGQLEKQVSVFAPDYKRLLAAAREEVDASN